jgi:SAM-dependent methyltransferase
METIALVLDAETRRRAQERPLRVLDPFAGVGRVHQLPVELPLLTVGVELEHEWAAAGGSLCGDATALPFADESFDAVATSPCYGNRMADSYDGSRDRCTSCRGTGCTDESCAGGMFRGADCSPCETCSGSGLTPSRRQTYRIALGRPLSRGSAASLQWGPSYRSLHAAAWHEARRVLRPGGLIVVNVSNHVRGGRVQPVAEWHLDRLLRLGFLLVEARAVATPRMRHGQNYDLRVEAEHVLVLRR